MELLVAMLVLVPLPAVLQIMVRARQRSRRATLWVDHPVQPTDQPFRGYKVAQLVAGPDNAWLAGVMGARYTVDAHASCLRGTCSPPEVSCSCGFYAFRDRTSAVALIGQLGSIHPTRSYVLLTVDLDGDVLEYEHGFRAQRQRVVRIEIADQCQTCALSGHRNAARWVTHPRFRSEQLFAQQDLISRCALPLGSAPVRPLCAQHTPATLAVRHTLIQLRGLVGTEVAILPAPEDAGTASPEAAA